MTLPNEKPGPTGVGQEVPMPSNSSTDETTVGPGSEKKSTTPESAQGAQTGDDASTTHDPYGHLPEDEAAILKRQVDVPEPKYSFFHLYRYATKLDLLIIAAAGACSMASGAAMPLMTIIFGGLQGVFQDYLVFKTIDYDEFGDQMVTFVLYFVYLAIGTFFTTYISTVGFIYTGEHIASNLRQQYLQSCLNQNIAFFDTVGAGEVAVKITVDADRVQDGISEKIGLLIASLSTLVTGYIIGFIISWKLTLIMSSVFVFLFFNTAFWSAFILKWNLPSIAATTKASSLTQEVFTAVRVVVAFGSQRHVAQQYDGHLKSMQHYSVRMKAAVGMMMAVVMGVMPLTYGLGFWQGSLFIARGELPLEKMITALMSVMIGSFNIGSIGPYMQGLTNAISTSANLMTVIDRETAINAVNNDKGDKPAEVTGLVQLRGIKHIYPSRPELTVLHDMTLDFEAGKVTALVGASGSGKSTIVGLIERFYEPVRGAVFLDGHNIDTLNIGWLRRQIGMVGQEPVLFAGSILDNIRHGLIGSLSEHADEETQRDLVIAAARKANAHDFITQLADGYDTDVGQRGALFSGGQKQRIAIARAIVSDPKILLLDEATSALDTKSEAVVQAALEQASVGRTTIAIAHRLSTIRNADKIVVMDSGRVVEQGTHAQLVASHGAYFELVNTQNFDRTNEPSTSTISDTDDENKEASDILTKKQTVTEQVHDAASLPSASSAANMNPVMKAIMNNQPELVPDKYSFWSLLKWTFSFAKPEFRIMIFASIFCVIAGLATPVHSVFFAKQMIILSNIGTPSYESWTVQSDSNFWSLMFLMLGLVTLIAYGIQSSIFAFATEALVRRIRRETLKQLLRQDVSFYDERDNSAGALTANLAMETTQLSTISGTSLGSMISSLTIIIGGSALSLAIAWKLALVCISVLPILIGCSFLRFWVLQHYVGRASRVYVDSAAYAAENIAAMRTVASLTLEAEITAKYRSTLNSQGKESLVSVAKSGAVYAFAQCALYLCLGLGFWYGSTRLASGEYDIFQFFVCLMSVIFGASTAGSLLTFIPDFVKARHSAARLRVLFDSHPKIDTSDDAQGKSLEQSNGRLEFRNVHFHYPTRPDRPVLRGLNLVVEPGQHIALVGPSGCGKSTTISLLERFYDPVNGQILIDGIDIAGIRPSEYRAHLALVSQEPALFQGTLRDNICLGRRGQEQVSDQALEAACHDANIYDFIVSLPEGFDTNIGSQGVLLSGGQKQRIAIARALIRQPKVLLLDEATSALDSESEGVVQIALNSAAEGRTTVTVAHRLATIKNADKILVINQGCVSESGTHSELLALGGLYAELVKLQSFESS